MQGEMSTSVGRAVKSILVTSVRATLISQSIENLPADDLFCQTDRKLTSCFNVLSYYNKNVLFKVTLAIVTNSLRL